LSEEGRANEKKKNKQKENTRVCGEVRTFSFYRERLKNAAKIVDRANAQKPPKKTKRLRHKHKAHTQEPSFIPFPFGFLYPPYKLESFLFFPFFFSKAIRF
jgi:hypothetical protein